MFSFCLRLSLWKKKKNEKREGKHVTLFSYKHTGELGWSSTCLRFSQWAWNYAWWYAFDMNTEMVSFKYSILNIQLSSTWILQWSL